MGRVIPALTTDGYRQGMPAGSKFCDCASLGLFVMQGAVAAAAMLVAAIGPSGADQHLVVPLHAAAQPKVAALLSHRQVSALEKGPVAGSIILRFDHPPGLGSALGSLVTDGVLIVSADFAGCGASSSEPERAAP